MGYISGWLIEGPTGSPPPRPEQGLPPYVSGGPIVPPAPPGIWPPPPHGEVVPPIALPPPPHVGGGPIYPPGDGSTPPDRPEQGPPDHVGGRPPGTPPEYPSGGPVPPGYIDNTLPVPPGVIWPPAGPGASGLYLALVVVAVGSTGQVTYKWTIVDPSLNVGWPLPGERPPHVGGRPPGGGERPDQGLPPSSGGEYPDQGLPGSQPGIDNTLPPGSGRPDAGLPPYAQPRR